MTIANFYVFGMGEPDIITVTTCYFLACESQALLQLLIVTYLACESQTSQLLVRSQFVPSAKYTRYGKVWFPDSKMSKCEI